MSLKITRKIGKTSYTLDVDPANLIVSLHNATWLKDAPSECSLCHSKNLDLSGRITVAKHGENAGKKFEYLEIRCLDCFAKATAGQFRDGKGYFWKNYGKMEKWNNPQNSTPTQGGNENIPPHNDGDVPF